MSKNIEMNYFNGSTYEKIVPSTVASDNSCFLTIETAELYGLGAAAVPNDVLAELGKYKQHWWRRRTNGSSWYPVYGATSTVTVCASENELRVKFRYADEIEISDSGVVSLKNPVEVNSPYSNYTELNQHKFFQTGVYPGQDYKSNVYYVPEGAADATRNYSDRTYYVYKTAGVVTSEYSQDIGDWEYVQSSNRNAYPDSGIQDGYEYEYLGVPLDNVVTAPKIETGSYVGTGTYWESNPNTLTFGFVPKLVIVYKANSFLVPNDGCYSQSFLWVAGQYVVNIYAISSISSVFISANGNTLSWYAGSPYGPERQCNVSEQKYNYIAIG